MKYIFAFLLCFNFLGISAQGIQKQIDSLLVVAETANDSVRLSLLNRVGYHYIFNDLPKAKEYLSLGLKEANEKENVYWQAAITSSYGIYQDVSGKSDSAGIYFERSLAIANQNNIYDISSNVTNNLGMYHWNRSEFTEALSYFFKAVDIERSNGDEKNERSKISNIGLIYQEMGQWDKALEYHKQALALREKYNLLHELPLSLNNIAIIQKEKNQFNEALTTINTSLAIAKKQKVETAILTALNTKGNILLLTQKEAEAIPLFKEAIDKRNTLNIDRKNNLENIVSLLHFYNSKGDVQQGLIYVKAGETLLIEFPELTANASEFFAESAKIYFRNNNDTKGMVNLELALASKDSLFSKQNAESMASLEAKFKVTEKEKALAETRANLAEKEIEITKKNTLIYGGFGLAIILGLLGYLFYNQQKLKNRQLKKEGELKTALAKIETQNKLQEQRLRISRDLHDNIGAQLTFIISSLDNLNFGFPEMKDKLAGKLASISAFTSQTIYELRDTIWAMNKEDISFEDLQIRIANFVEKARGVSNTLVHFTVDKAIAQNATLSSVVGMNVYRIIQEGVNNAIKYADSNSIEINISEIKGTFQVIIKDNGKGYRIDGVEMGNGLNNIKKRTRDIKGSVAITSEIEKGTKIKLTFPK